MSPLYVIDLGRMEYDTALELQEGAVAAVAEGRLPDLLLLVEHSPVYTFGRGGREEHLLASPEELARQGATVRRTARGGDVTYHGPGQLVGYPILDLGRQGRDLHRYVRGLEEALIRTLAEFGVPGARLPRLTGVWVGEAKIAAIGVAVRRWVSYHGFALNVSVDLERFGAIIPCGIPDRGVTSLHCLVPDPDWNAVRSAVIRHLADVFALAPEVAPRSLLRAPRGKTSSL